MILGIISLDHVGRELRDSFVYNKFKCKVIDPLKEAGGASVQIKRQIK